MEEERHPEEEGPLLEEEDGPEDRVGDLREHGKKEEFLAEEEPDGGGRRSKENGRERQGMGISSAKTLYTPMDLASSSTNAAKAMRRTRERGIGRLKKRTRAIIWSMKTKGIRKMFARKRERYGCTAGEA